MELVPEPLPLRTDLAVLPFAVLLASARALRLTGVLDVRGEHRVSLSRGNPVHVESATTDDSGEHLLRMGAIRESALGAARQIARSRGQPVGEALLGLGKIGANELFEHRLSRTR